ncbi:MAG: AAA family ATPase [Kiritimatiellales bacterium]|nr:AAA family ATPase [Kiritimatiellales bacterium]
MGPRGTGKSTWLESRFKEALWINLLEPDVHRRFAAHPERLADVLEGSPEQKTIVIDEVQKVPELLTVVHQSIEKKKGYRFILTGSSARKLKRSGMDLLAGRAAVSFTHPFMAAELGAAFSLDEALRLGTVPLVLAAEDPDATLAAYVMLYVREEVMAEGLVRDIGGFSRFLEAISFSHAAVLNVAEVSRECEVSRKTVEGYVSVLEDMLLGNRIPVFSRRAKRTLIKQSKFYFSDCGVFRSVRPKGPLDRPEEMDGAALEGLVYQHLKAWIDYSEGSNELFFWRTQSGAEVDFVVYGESQFCALEVKNSRKVNRKDLRALKTFRNDYPESMVALLYRGTERLLMDGVWCIPCDGFLRQLKPFVDILRPTDSNASTI